MQSTFILQMKLKKSSNRKNNGKIILWIVTDGKGKWSNSQSWKNNILVGFKNFDDSILLRLLQRSSFKNANLTKAVKSLKVLMTNWVFEIRKGSIEYAEAKVNEVPEYKLIQNV